MKTVKVKLAGSGAWTAAHPSANIGHKAGSRGPVLVVKAITDVPDDVAVTAVLLAVNRATFVRPFAGPHEVEWIEITGRSGIIIRPAKEDTAKLNVRFPQSLHARLVVAAAQAGRSLNDEIIEACRKHLCDE